jgi:hypothetical protein
MIAIETVFHKTEMMDGLGRLNDLLSPPSHLISEIGPSAGLVLSMASETAIPWRAYNEGIGNQDNLLSVLQDKSIEAARWMLNAVGHAKEVVGDGEKIDLFPFISCFMADRLIPHDFFREIVLSAGHPLLSATEVPIPLGAILTHRGGATTQLFRDDRLVRKIPSVPMQAALSRRETYLFPPSWKEVEESFLQFSERTGVEATLPHRGWNNHGQLWKGANEMFVFGMDKGMQRSIIMTARNDQEGQSTTSTQTSYLKPGFREQHSLILKKDPDGSWTADRSYVCDDAVPRSAEMDSKERQILAFAGEVWLIQGARIAIADFPWEEVARLSEGAEQGGRLGKIPRLWKYVGLAKANGGRPLTVEAFPVTEETVDSIQFSLL